MSGLTSNDTYADAYTWDAANPSDISLCFYEPNDVNWWKVEFNQVLKVTTLQFTMSLDEADLQLDLYRATNATYWRRIVQVCSVALFTSTSCDVEFIIN